MTEREELLKLCGSIIRSGATNDAATLARALKECLERTPPMTPTREEIAYLIAYGVKGPTPESRLKENAWEYRTADAILALFAEKGAPPSPLTEEERKYIDAALNTQFDLDVPVRREGGRWVAIARFLAGALKTRLTSVPSPPETLKPMPSRWIHPNVSDEP
jgi:hypothetical protein